MPEIYVSTDVEADGPIPGPHSMLSFASAAFRPDKTMVATFEANLATLPDAQGDAKTMEWWRGQPDAWAACRANPREPAEVMPAYVAWLKALPGKPVFVGYPAAYDFMFVYWYLIRFAGESPFSHSALDIKSYAMAILGTEFRASVNAICRPHGSTICPILMSLWTMRKDRERCSATCLRLATSSCTNARTTPVYEARCRSGKD